MDQRPIGFFDSGLGGVSVLRAAIRALPQERYLYYGDNKNAPYGGKSVEEITRLTLLAADELVHHNIKALVIACNTATATCIRQVREILSVPVVSVEPAIRPACRGAGTGSILMLATLATTRLDRYLALQQAMPEPERIINVPCPGLVARIEAGVIADNAFDDLLDEYLMPYWGAQVDGIVLGCTHYPFIRGAISRYAHMHFSGSCRLYDGGEGTARQLARVLAKNGLLGQGGNGETVFLTSGDARVYLPLFQRFLALPYDTY